MFLVSESVIVKAYYTVLLFTGIEGVSNKSVKSIFTIQKIR